MATESKEERLLEVTLATWTYQLFTRGVAPADDALRAACEGVRDAADAEAGDAAGIALVDRVAVLVEGEDASVVLAYAKAQYGDRAREGMGDGSRDDRAQRIRKYQFAQNLPWLARIWERRDGTVKPTWLLVERFTDEVTAADPNPWNDIDEERRIPVADFHVMWELDGTTSVYVV